MKRLKKFIQRLREWRALARNAPLLPMLKALRTGTVDLKTYRQRIRACRRCPIYNLKLKACHVKVSETTLGCGCYVPFLAKTRTPYQQFVDVNAVEAKLGLAPRTIRGCWGRATYGAPFGWGEGP